MTTMDVTTHVTPDEITRYGPDGFVAETTDTEYVVWHGYRVLRIPITRPSRPARLLALARRWPMVVMTIIAVTGYVALNLAWWANT